MKRSIVTFFTVAAIALSLAACGSSGGGGGGGTTTTALKGLAACSAVSGEAVICGTALAPDGTTPIVGAEVSLVTSSASTSLKGLYYDGVGYKLTPSDTECLTDATGAFACSGVTSSGSYNFQIVGGGFTISISSLDVTVGDVENIPASQTTATNDDTSLKVVVATGEWDEVQNVIKNVFECDRSVTDGDYSGDLTIGNECEMLEIVDGGDGSTGWATNPNTALTTALGLAAGEYPTISQLLDSPTALALFDVVLLNCNDVSTTVLSNGTYQTNLQTYVENGGNVYISDRSGDYLEQYFPEHVEWHGTTVGDGLTTTPEPVNVGWDASMGSQTVAVDDAGMLAWMQAEGLTSGAGNDEFAVTFIGGEMIMQQLGTSVSLLVSASTVLGIGDLPIAGKTFVPMSISFPMSSGCVFYTTFHTENTATTAQQKVLEYMVLNKVSNCN